MKINWKVRFKNPLFIAQFILAILAPVLVYLGLNYSDLTTWVKVGEVLFAAISNPYVLASVLVSVWQTVNDPTTKGHSDSPRAMSYKKAR